MEQTIDLWLWKYLRWFDTMVGWLGFDLVFLVSLGAVALGVQMGCYGSRRRRTILTSTGLVLTGTVAIGQGAALVGMNMVGKLKGTQSMAWWWITAFLALVATAGFAAQIVQHVQLLRRMKRGESLV